MRSRVDIERSSSLPACRGCDRLTPGMPVTFVLAVLAILLAGCTTVGPDYTAPEAATPEAWLDIDAPAITDSPEDHSRWWATFDDPTLSSLVLRAREQNLTLRIAGLRVLEARASLGIARGNQYPQSQQITGGVAAVRLSDNEAGSRLDPRFTTAETSFDLGWELDFWGRFQRAIESASAQLDASIADYDDVMVTLVAEVARSYVLIRTFEERLALTRRNVAAQQDALRIADVKFQNGAVTELDVQQARAVLNNTRAAIPALESAKRQAGNALAVLLGLPPQRIDDLLAGDSGIPTPPPQVSMGVPAELLRRRPDVRRAERLLAAQSAQTGLAVSDLYPRFSLVGSVGFRTSDSSQSSFSMDSSLGDIVSAESTTGFLGPFVSWNVLNYGRIKNNIRVQDARFQQLLVGYQSTVLSALAETENAIVAYLQAHDQGRFLGESAAAAQRSVELALVQYREGKTEFNRVIDALNFLLQRQNELAEVTGDVAINLIAMYKSVGGGYEAVADGDSATYVSDTDKEQLGRRTRYWRKQLPQ